jgi:hypothetical protein
VLVAVVTTLWYCGVSTLGWCSSPNVAGERNQRSATNGPQAVPFRGIPRSRRLEREATVVTSALCRVCAGGPEGGLGLPLALWNDLRDTSVASRCSSCNCVTTPGTTMRLRPGCALDRGAVRVSVPTCNTTPQMANCSGRPRWVYHIPRVRAEPIEPPSSDCRRLHPLVTSTVSGKDDGRPSWTMRPSFL